jgi:hypothetical protein
MFVEKSRGLEAVPAMIDKDSDILSDAAFMWEAANKHYKDYIDGNIYGVEKTIDDNLLILE